MNYLVSLDLNWLLLRYTMVYAVLQCSLSFSLFMLPKTKIPLPHGKVPFIFPTPPFLAMYILLNVKGYLSHKPPNSSFHFIIKWYFWRVFVVQFSHLSINAANNRLKHLINAKLTIALGSMLSLRGLWRIFWETSSSSVILLTLSSTVGFSAYLGKKSRVTLRLPLVLSLTVGFEPDLDLFNFCSNGPSSTQGSFDEDIPYIYKLVVEK